MRVLPDHTYSDSPGLHVVVIPGGSGARREMDNLETTEWLRRTAQNCTWIASVCTGAFLLVGAGLAEGRKVTTHHDFLDDLRAMGRADVVDGVRFVRDGNIVSAGGVMSGIEMSLWLVRQVERHPAVAEPDMRHLTVTVVPPISTTSWLQSNW